MGKHSSDEIADRGSTHQGQHRAPENTGIVRDAPDGSGWSVASREGRDGAGAAGERPPR